MTADQLANAIMGVIMVVVPVAGGWAWRTQTDITMLKTRDENEKEWREELKARFDRLENKVDAALQRK